jgi:hypothetical protein
VNQFETKLGLPLTPTPSPNQPSSPPSQPVAVATTPAKVEVKTPATPATATPSPSPVVPAKAPAPTPTPAIAVPAAVAVPSSTGAIDEKAQANAVRDFNSQLETAWRTLNNAIDNVANQRATQQVLSYPHIHPSILLSFQSSQILTPQNGTIGFRTWC